MSKSKESSIKSVSQMLQDSELESKPEIETTDYSPNKLAMKQMYMLQAFQVFITKILDNHGNVSIMARKSQLAQTEIDNALILTRMVGDSYDALVNKPD